MVSPEGVFELIPVDLRSGFSGAAPVVGDGVGERKGERKLRCKAGCEAREPLKIVKKMEPTGLQCGKRRAK
jgi:hypothetical protein